MDNIKDIDNYREIFLTQQIYATIFSLTNKMQAKEAKYLHKLTSRQIMAIIAIYHLKNEEPTLNNIARKLGTTKQSVKQIITILENKGYVVTTPSKNDKRAVNVTVTKEGEQALSEAGKEAIYFFAEFSRTLTREEMEILWILLKKLYSFDGEEMDGFEEEVDGRIGIDEKEMEKEAREMAEVFSRIRNGGNKK